MTKSRSRKARLAAAVVLLELVEVELVFEEDAEVGDDWLLEGEVEAGLPSGLFAAPS